METTPTQLNTLRLIRAHLARHGYPPSLRELARAAGVTPNAVTKHLHALARAGLITLPERRTARGIRLTGMSTAASDALALPLIGRVAAGAPIMVEANVERTLTVDASVFKPAPDYLLRVEGTSMIDAGIEDGDLIAVQRTPVAENGQIVVARLDDAFTVKVWQRDARGVRLLPRNAAYAPIVVDATRDLAIEGLYCGLIRGAT